MKILDRQNKSRILFGILGLTFCIALYIWWSIPGTTQEDSICAFCNPAIIRTHTFYEDPYVRGLCTHKPLQPFHCLVVIKRHIKRFEEASDREILAAYQLIKKINSIVQEINGPSSYLILEKNGPEVGQTVPHVHIHYIPKRMSTNKNVPLFGLLGSFIFSPLQHPMSKEKLSQCVETFKKEFEHDNH
jgi:diadenosine tetraphosphate (Ap4A) HIT family hydrolase